jgi:hypothetical protein
MDHFTTKINVEEWYNNNPLGTIDDVEVTDEERRHCELLGKEELTEAEAIELELLSDKFVTHLDREMEVIKF